MLSTVLKFKKAFEWLYEDDSTYRYYFEQTDDEKSNKRDGPPDENDWNIVYVFMVS